MSEPIVQSVASLILRANMAAAQGDYAQAQAADHQALKTMPDRPGARCA